MPKMNMYPHPLPNQPEGADTRLEIGWHEGTVTVATTKLTPGVDRDREYLDGPPGELREAWAGQRLGFDRRYQINHLIRELREARDKAFGKDE
jgi:hypothetical protein